MEPSAERTSELRMWQGCPLWHSVVEAALYGNLMLRLPFMAGISTLFARKAMGSPEKPHVAKIEKGLESDRACHKGQPRHFSAIKGSLATPLPGAMAAGLSSPPPTPWQQAFPHQHATPTFPRLSRLRRCHGSRGSHGYHGCAVATVATVSAVARLPSPSRPPPAPMRTQHRSRGGRHRKWPPRNSPLQAIVV